MTVYGLFVLNSCTDAETICIHIRELLLSLVLTYTYLSYLLLLYHTIPLGCDGPKDRGGRVSVPQQGHRHDFQVCTSRSTGIMWYSII